jgi:DNA-binding IclR family transcriptional regulator
MPARKSPPEYAVPALDRGLDIVEALSASPVPLSLTDLGRTLHYPPSGLFRLMSRFEKRRYVVREPVSGKYSLTLKLFELAHTHSPVDNLLQVAERPMRELAAEVGESVHLGLLSHGRLVVLIDVGSPSRVRLSIETGSQFPPIHTNSGRLLLAMLPPDRLAAFLEQDPDYLPLPMAARRRLRDELAAIRRKGYAVSPSRDRAGLMDVSVPVGNPEIGHVAALAIACLRAGSRNGNLRLVRPMHRCAAEIALAQGLNHVCAPIL